jgi:hypothetical protein
MWRERGIILPARSADFPECASLPLFLSRHAPTCRMGWIGKDP